MQHTSCTEDRIQHALDRCLEGLRRSAVSQQHAHAAAYTMGHSMNRWSLEELVKRDPQNFLILLEQIIRKTKEVQDQCQYELVAPLAIMFSSTLLQTPYCPPDAELLEEAVEVFRCFLTWPEPYSRISFHRLVREEQGLHTTGSHSKTVTVLLMNPGEVPPEFLSVGQQLSDNQHSHRDTVITLIKHAYQSALGTKYPLASIDKALQAKSLPELEDIFSMVTDVMETAATMSDPQEGYGHMIQSLETLWEKLDVPASSVRQSDEVLQTLPLPAAKCYMFHWEKDNFDVLNVLVENEHDLEDLQTLNGQTEEEECVSGDEEDGDEYTEDIDFEEELPSFPNSCAADHRASTLSTNSSLSASSTFSIVSVASESYTPSLSSVTSSTDSGVEDADDSSYSVSPSSSSPVSEKSSPKPGSKASARITQLYCRIFTRPQRRRILNRAKSLGNPESKNLLVPRSQRSHSLPQQVHLRRQQPPPQPQVPALRHVCFHRRPILSSDEETKSTTLRVVVFGADHTAGKVARAYSSLRRRESACPHLSRLFRLQFYFVPVRRDSGAGPESPMAPSPVVQAGGPHGAVTSTDPHALGTEDSTNDIAHLLGLLDPWYERNTLSLLNLPANVVCQQTSKMESESCDSSYECRLPILADLVLYYCRHATRSALIQLYQAELTLAGGERRTEVFIHSLELGHTAGTRAVKAMGSAKKRFGIDGDREAVPLRLEVLYNKVVVSGRSQWKRETKVCTSLTLTKACKNPEELGMLRWTLNKKVQNSPDGNLSLVRVVVRELEKTAHIPDELCKRVYDFCKRLLTFPQPYCSTGLSYSRHMKAERRTPGLMYQRMVVAEQSLKNTFQERVFVFADPEVFSGPLGTLLQADIQASGSGPRGLLTPLDHMSSVIQHSIQAVLGPQQRFSVSPDHRDALEMCDLLTPGDTLRHSVMSVDSGIERDLPPGAADPDHTSPYSEPLKNEKDAGGKLNRRGCMKMKPTVSDSMVLMRDTLEEHGGLGGGEGLGEGSAGGRKTLQRRTGGGSASQASRPFTARIVIMGDDRALGRLAKAYYCLRKREARKLFLTQKVNLQFYYIPVSASPVKESVPPNKENCCAFGSYLGMVDPWYDCNIRSLGVTIPELAKKHTNTGQKESLLSDVISYYVRMGRQPVYFSIYEVKISFCCLTTEPVEQVFLSHLEMEFPEFRRISPSYKRVTLSGRDVDTSLSVKMSGAQISAIPDNETDLNCLTLTLNEAQTKNKSNLVQKTRISNIKIHSLEKRSFTVLLDKDSRRAFKDVQR
ncbi:hypothetical protein NHX12_018153 [Muraenolepis orangiensis]|uniref:Phosphoinositide 3-kinase regulatory subunit 5 n=1 Tax=Muraenolepis orangiensis TaxID=630683 RepID=A0A9Q0EZ92_9TELE|nr:hypothetical protein NHX12_018153 [Muraenolepis orangiensis]